MCGSAISPTPEQLAHPPPKELERLLMGMYIDLLADHRRSSIRYFDRLAIDKMPVTMYIRGSGWVGL
jgi:hypothetical protein